MANKSAHKARMRAQIVGEASQALRAHGVNGISVADLMKRAGLTHGGFYAYFASRDDLVAAAVETMFEGTGRMLDMCLEGRSPREGLAALLDFYLAEGNIRSVEKGCPLPALSGETARMPEAARRSFETGIRLFRDRLAATLAQAGFAGGEPLAAAILSEMVGSIVLARSMPDHEAAMTFADAARVDLKQRLGLA